MISKVLLSTLLVSGIVCSSFAQEATETTVINPKYLYKHQTIPHFYLAGAMDGAIFSTATIHHDASISEQTGALKPAVDTRGILRFTYFVNLGATFNFNFSKHIGLYTGIDIKNVGYIEQDNGFTTKRRTYNVGAPLGLKIGNMKMNGSYAFLGGGLDVAINFQEKYFSDRNNKQRINEWWSDRTPRTMPYVFAGYSFNHHVTVKAQYYINNYMNTDFQDNTGKYIYNGTDVHLILLSVGFGMNMKVHNKKTVCYNHTHCNCSDHKHGR